MDNLDIGKAFKLCMDEFDFSVEDVMQMSGCDEDTVRAILDNGDYDEAMLDKVLEAIHCDRDDLAVMTVRDEFKRLAMSYMNVSCDVAEFILQQRIAGCVDGVLMSCDSMLGMIGCEALDAEQPIDKSLIIIQVCHALGDLREYGESVKVYDEGVEVDEEVFDDTVEDPEVRVIEGDDPWPADDSRK